MEGRAFGRHAIFENPVSTQTLVTGATGLLGSEIVRQLLAQGQSVRVLRRASSALDLLGESAAHVEHAFGDVTDPEAVAEAMQGISHVYHVAAWLGTNRPADVRHLMEVNVGGTRHVVNAALRHGVKRIVHTSSMAAFGRPDSSAGAPLLNEDAQWTPSRMNTPYAESKYLAELEIHRAIAEGLDATLVNPALVFGLGRTSENTMQIAWKVYTRALPAIPTGGTNVVDVRDVAAAHLVAMERGETGRRYFLGSQNLLWSDILGTLAHALGVKPPRFTVGPRVSLVLGALSEAVSAVTRTSPVLTRERARAASSFYHYDNARARTELGCTFRPFEETAQWMAEGIRTRTHSA